MNSSPTPNFKPGPKGKVLEPYAREILLKAREGHSMADIAKWLAKPPRDVVITRQAIHQWLKARIRKLVKLNEDFAGTGVTVNFQQDEPSAVVRADPSSSSKNESPPAQAPPLLQSIATPAQRRKTNMDDFMVSEADMSQANNPLLPKR